MYSQKELYMEITIVSEFLNEEYSYQDFIYFLFVRSCMEAELGINFLEIAERKERLGSVDHHSAWLYLFDLNKLIKAISGSNH